MKLGIMQPYFVPYIGYWQLINAVDKYVVYDDVNFIKGGWINRNRILVNGQIQFFNIPMLGASSFKLISEIGVNNNPKLINKNLRTIENAYKKAPYYQSVFPLIQKILECGKENIADYVFFSLQSICDYLNIKTELILSSSLKKDCNLKGKEKVLSICNLLSATEYYNAIGGQELYAFSEFKENGIQLKFLETKNIEYKQFGEEFQPNLSIIDVLMFNTQGQIKSMLNQYDLIM